MRSETGARGELDEVSYTERELSNFSLREMEGSMAFDPGGHRAGERVIRRNTSDACLLQILRCCITLGPMIMRAVRTTY